jgi:hypothetical protein
MAEREPGFYSPNIPGEEKYTAAMMITRTDAKKHIEARTGLPSMMYPVPINTGNNALITQTIRNNDIDIF